MVRRLTLTVLVAAFVVSSAQLHAGNPLSVSRDAPLPAGDRPARLEIVDAKVLGAAAADTFWFGGTVWAADSARWEAIEGGVWTFDSGIGSAIQQPGDPGYKQPGLSRLMEGWSGWDLSADADRPWFRRLTESDFAGESAICVGASAGLSGSASLWAGVLTTEADGLCYVDGRGYGNGWNLTVAKTFSYSGSGDVILHFDYVNETETGFDFTYVEVDHSGTGAGPIVEIAAYDGYASHFGHYVLSQAAGDLPAAAGTIAIRFRVDSDNSYSDQDGLDPTTCGAFAVDNIILGGAITDTSSFETGDDGWTLLPNPPGPGGDWSDLEAVADLPNAPPPGCGLSDSVLVFWDRDSLRIEPAQYNLAVSPWIDLERAGKTGLFGWVLEFDIYQDFVRPDHVGFTVAMQTRPCDATGIPGGGFIIPYGCFFGPDPCLYTIGCNRARLTIDPARLDAGISEVRFAVGVFNQCEIWGDCPGDNTDSTPYFDNIRFGVFDTTSVQTGIPGDVADGGLRLGMAATLVRTGEARFLLAGPEGAPATLRIYDVAGRLVSTAWQGDLSGTAGTASWNLRDAAGRPVRDGVYFARLSGAGSRSVRFVVLR